MFTPSDKTKNLKQSGIRAASTRCAKIGGINLGQGVCDMPTPEIIKAATYQAIESNHNMYSACEGILPLRQAIADKLASFNGIKTDAETEVIVTHGSTGAFISAITTLFNPGDEIILFEPFYGYHKNILELQGFKTRGVSINLENFEIDFDALNKAITPQTRGIIICTPCNPSGKVFTKEELLKIGAFVKQHNLWVITDEIYEYITYPGYTHISPASLDDFKNCTITISGFSKTYNMTGWRLGYATGPAEVIAKMALVHDLLYICPPTPLQYGVLAAFNLQHDYYEKMRATYLNNRNVVVEVLTKLGFKITVPQGAYYLLADFSNLPFADDEEAATKILEKAKVATVPGRAFFTTAAQGKNILRVCFALNEIKIAKAMQQLEATTF